MIDTLKFEQKDGDKTSPAITVYALSTCGFCKRSMAFLEANGYSYRFIYLDKIPLETKTEVKKELKEKYKTDVAFPFVTVGNSDYLVGFIEVDWRKTLGL
ncbi:MAG: glutaredoxin family protein [Clostridia bacterium]|jgi:glutaredoxin|nr:glutaredoxin domain-containing protein [Spirochaetia bacterium]